MGLLADGTRRRLLPTDVDVQYVAPDLLMFLDGDTLLAQPFDADRLALSGTPTPVAARVGRSSRGNGAYSMSTSGTLAYAPAMQQAGRLAWFDRTGSPLGSAGPEGEHDYTDFRLSPDNASLAASLVDPTLSLPNIWSMDLVRGGTSRWTFGPALNAAVLWSPAGEEIVFRTNRKGLIELYRRRPFTGARDEPLLAEEQARSAGVGASNMTPTDWSADGRHIAFTANTPSDIWLLPLDNANRPVPFVQSPGDQMHGNFSPDGRYLAYTSNESGRHEVHVETSPVSERKWPISTSGGYEPRWRADGRELYYLSEDRTLMAVPVTSGAVPFGVPRALFQTRVHEGVSLQRTHYVPSGDGQRFLIHTRSGEVAASTITVVLNWNQELKQRVPTR